MLSESGSSRSWSQKFCKNDSLIAFIALSPLHALAQYIPKYDSVKENEISDMTDIRRTFNVHGDNIVECERTLQLIEMALAGEHPTMRGPYGSPTNPAFEFTFPRQSKTLEFVFYPGFGRWNEDIRQLIRDGGGIIREAPDVIISEITSGQEHPLLAMEYSGALAAGNQAWQRNGRAYSFGLAQVPYLYVAELGGYELNAARERRATRLPNPAVPFSYLSFSSSMDTPVLPVFVPNPGVDKEIRESYESVIGEDELVEFVRVALLIEDDQPVTEELEQKALTFVRRLAAASRPGRTLTPDQWSDAYDAVSDGDGNNLVSFLIRETSLPWSKTAYIQGLTDSAKELMAIASRLSIGLTSVNLPICLVPPGNRSAFADEVQSLYPAIGTDFLDWLRRPEPLAICWVMGFKPRGDDARPDRGLPPLIRMLVGPDTEVMTVVYGPAPSSHWESLLRSPEALALQNGLWEAIMAASNAIIADSATDHVTNHGILREHWERAVTPSHTTSMLVASPPQRIGEHDVDTVIHTLFARIGSEFVFEGMCNPPGGDWSGISLLTGNKGTELRWLSLPRVSGVESKRPDHVLQLFGVENVPIVFAIESKETPRSVETNIGPRLVSYMENLLASPASIEKERNETQEWQHSVRSLDPGSLHHTSGVAFLMRDERDLSSVEAKAEADLVIGLRFSRAGDTCVLHLLPSTDDGQTIVEFIERLPLGHIGLTIEVHQKLR